MVKLTKKYLISKISPEKQFLVRRKHETDLQFLKRITHLYLQNQFIDQIAKITDCPKVTVVYLQNNMLRTLDNINSFPNLTHLYLQRNFLGKIDHLESLTHLKKIYLGFNEILVLEGFTNSTNLKEIHIENQDLPIGETLFFEPQTISNLEGILQVLDISRNNISTLCELRGLLRLEVFIANDNCLSDLSDVINTLTQWPFLKKLSLINNPVTEERWYRDGAIFASKSLEVLDDKPVHEITRTFIEGLTERRNCLTRRAENKDYDLKPETEEDRKNGKSVTFREDSNFQEHLIGPLNNLTTASFYFPPWKLRANINPVNPKTFLPRPYWKKPGLRSSNNKSQTANLQF